MAERYSHNTASAIGDILQLGHRFASHLCAALIIIAFIQSSYAGAGNALTLAWDPNPDENIAGYKLHYGTAPGTYDQVIDVGNGSTGTVTDLSANITYYFVVTAYNDIGLESPPSNEVSYALDPEELPSPDDTDDNNNDDGPDAEDDVQGPGSNENATAFAGLIISSADNDHASASPLNGFVSVRVARRQGSATGKLSLNGETYRFEGAFDGLGRLAIAIDRGPWLPMLTFLLQLEPGSRRITGWLSTGGDTPVTIELQARTSERTLLTPLQGRYTVILTPENVAPTEPQGYGIGLLNVSARGNVRFSATLPDGTKMTTSGAIDTNGEFSFYAPLYEDSAGFLAGTITFEDVPNESDAHATLLRWSKPIRVLDPRFKAAFAIDLSMRAAKYMHPFNSAPLLPGLATSGGRALISFTGGNLPDAAPNTPDATGTASLRPASPVTIYTRQGVPTLWAFGQPITATFNPTNGLFRGTFAPSGLNGSRTSSFSGVLFQKGGEENAGGYGRGLFLDWNQTGRVELEIETLTKEKAEMLKN